MILKVVVKVGPESWVSDGGWRQCDSLQIPLQDGQLCSHVAATAQAGHAPAPPLPRLGFGSIIALLGVARLRLFIEEKILCCFIFRATRMENITSSIYDVISKGIVASVFTYYK